MNSAELWRRYQHFLCRVPSLDLTLDIDGLLAGAAACKECNHE
jgi:hypothetical protein